MARSLALTSLAVAAAGTGTAPAIGADLDTLDLARSTVAATIPLQWDEDEQPLGSYLLVRGGVNILTDPTMNLASFSAGTNLGLDGTGLPLNPLTPMSGGSIRDAKLHAGTGYDIELGLGLKVADDVVIELATGVVWNPIDRVNGRLDFETEEPDGLGGVNTLHWISDAMGGDGELYQVPLTVSVLFDAEIAEGLRLTAGIGGGVEWSRLQVDDIRSNTYTGAYIQDPETGDPTLIPLAIDLDGESIALRYQAMLALSYEIFPGGFLGGYVRYSGTSILDYGTIGFDRSPNNLYREGSDVEIPYLRNLAVGGSFTITF